MPAPNTSTDKMPTVDSSQATLKKSRTWVASTAAARSARPITTSGTIHSTGLR